MTNDKKDSSPFSPTPDVEKMRLKAEHESIPEPFWAKRERNKGVRRFFRWVISGLLFLIVLILVVLIGVGVWIKRFYAPIDVHSADKTRLAGWILLRDFGTEKPEIRSQLVERYIAPLQNVEKIDLTSPAAKKIVPYAKNYAEERQEKLAKWEAGKTRRSFVRTDYRIIPSGSDHRYIALADIQPTPNLTEYLDELKKSGKSAVFAAETKTENNVRVLAKEWFLQQMKNYDDAPEAEKASVIERTASELNHLSSLYNNTLVEIGLPEQTEMEQLRDLHFMTDAWFDDTPSDELARLLWFKDLILTIFIAQHSGMTENIDSLIRLPAPKTKARLLPFPPLQFKKEASPEKSSPPQNESPIHSDDSDEGDPTDFF